MNIEDNVPMPRLIDVPAVCAITSLSVSRIYALISEGELRKVKLGGKTVFVEAEIRAWLEAKIAASPRQSAAAA
ncbi:helix-turn-helix transcriptional regulator [Qipengyuania sediminis]|uniref:helix-turn-helix transcriptional regulator n=1 Tax=Qipengyuania sediminis TaxID=1532023 RepID=UPI001404B136|nr:helix-turn-helix domain-containing protein [Qipengyuania sediminis]